MRSNLKKMAPLFVFFLSFLMASIGHTNSLKCDYGDRQRRSLRPGEWLSGNYSRGTAGYSRYCLSYKKVTRHGGVYKPRRRAQCVPGYVRSNTSDYDKRGRHCIVKGKLAAYMAFAGSANVYPYVYSSFDSLSSSFREIIGDHFSKNYYEVDYSDENQIGYMFISGHGIKSLKKKMNLCFGELLDLEIEKRGGVISTLEKVEEVKDNMIEACEVFLEGSLATYSIFDLEDESTESKRLLRTYRMAKTGLDFFKRMMDSSFDTMVTIPARVKAEKHKEKRKRAEETRKAKEKLKEELEKAKKEL